MIAFKFLFTDSPAGEEEPLEVSMIAQSEEEAWQGIAKRFNTSVEILKSLSPTIQSKLLRPGEIIVSQSRTAVDSDDLWAQIVSKGLRDITQAISGTVGTTKQNRVQVELERLKIDKFIIYIFALILLGTLAFSFYLIVINNQDPVFKFAFPLITAVIGLISGYFAGRGSAGGMPR